MNFAPKRCVQCNVEFTPNSGRQEVCSDTCRKIKFRLRERAYRRSVYKLDPEHRLTKLATGKRIRDQERDAVFAAYGGYKCVCCEETEVKFLTIDHIDDNGAAHRRSIGSGGSRLYRWLRKHNFPSGFQVMCLNCNLGRYRNNGVCPHKVMVTRG
jgi:hypothetical protein